MTERALTPSLPWSRLDSLAARCDGQGANGDLVEDSRTDWQDRPGKSFAQAVNKVVRSHYSHPSWVQPMSSSRAKTPASSVDRAST